MRVDFTVYGKAQPQGSTRAYVSKSGRVSITSTNKALLPWRQEVSLVAKAAVSGMDDSAFNDGAFMVDVSFGFIRPKTVPFKKRPRYTVKPDIDKLLRASLDSLTGVIFRDDSQVSRVTCEKRYDVENYTHFRVQSIGPPL